MVQYIQDTAVQAGELKIDLAQRSVSANDIEVRLTNMEFEILYLLASNPGRVFLVEQIYSIMGMYYGEIKTFGHNEVIRLSYWDTPDEVFEEYKRHKQADILIMADKYKNKEPKEYMAHC